MESARRNKNKLFLPRLQKDFELIYLCYSLNFHLKTQCRREALCFLFRCISSQITIVCLFHKMYCFY
jgi:hypothetical protein